MDDIYNVLVTMDFPDAITHGLRRTTDNMRGVLEKTRSDLTLTIRQKALEDRLR
jgi:translin